MESVAAELGNDGDVAGGRVLTELEVVIPSIPLPMRPMRKLTLDHVAAADVTAVYLLRG